MAVDRFRSPRISCRSGGVVLAIGCMVVGVVVPSGVAAASVVNKSNFAGYLFTNAPTAVTATFTVPSLDCTSVTGQVIIGAGVEGPFGPSGAGFVNADLLAACFGGTAHYSGSFGSGTTGGGTSTPWSFTPVAGDRLAITVATPSGTSYQMKVRDATQAKGSKRSGSCSSCGGGTGSIEVNGNTPPPFGTIRWSSVTVNGGTLAAAGPMRYEQVNGTHVLIRTSAISSSGTSFTSTFVASS